MSESLDQLQKLAEERQQLGILAERKHVQELSNTLREASIFYYCRRYSNFFHGSLKRICPSRQNLQVLRMEVEKEYLLVSARKKLRS